VEDKEKKGEKVDFNLTATFDTRIKNFVKLSNVSCINGEELNYYTNGLRDELQRVLQPVMS